jgi:hypothetical protein
VHSRPCSTNVYLIIQTAQQAVQCVTIYQASRSTSAADQPVVLAVKRCCKVACKSCL